MTSFYPPLAPENYPPLKPLISAPIATSPGQQSNFKIEPAATCEYEFRTFGTSDAVMVLFEDDNGAMRYLAGDDDSGESRNATLRVKLMSGHKYVLRVRMYFSFDGEAAVMMF